VKPRVAILARSPLLLSIRMARSLRIASSTVTRGTHPHGDWIQLIEHLLVRKKAFTPTRLRPNREGGLVVGPIDRVRCDGVPMGVSDYLPLPPLPFRFDICLRSPPAPTSPTVAGACFSGGDSGAPASCTMSLPPYLSRVVIAPAGTAGLWGFGGGRVWRGDTHHGQCQLPPIQEGAPRVLAQFSSALLIPCFTYHTTPPPFPKQP